MRFSAIEDMEKNNSVTSQQTIFRLLFFLILISNFSVISFGQSFPLQEKEVALPEQAMEQVVKRILTWTFKPRTKPTTVYLAEQRIKQAWLPTIKNIDFRLLSADEIEQKNLEVYFFTNPYLSEKAFNIILMFGTASCDNVEYSYPWRFRILKQKVKLWSSKKGFGGGCGIAFLDAVKSVSKPPLF